MSTYWMKLRWKSDHFKSISYFLQFYRRQRNYSYERTKCFRERLSCERHHEVFFSCTDLFCFGNELYTAWRQILRPDSKRKSQHQNQRRSFLCDHWNRTIWLAPRTSIGSYRPSWIHASVKMCETKTNLRREQKEVRLLSFTLYSSNLPNWTEATPPQAFRKFPSSELPINFISAVLGEWSDTTKSMSPSFSAIHSFSRFSLLRIGGQHLNSTRASGTSSAHNDK